MKHLLSPLRWLPCALLLWAGCASYDFQTLAGGLRVELTGIERAGDGTVSVSWNVVNPNVSSYLLGQIENEVFLEGTLVGTILESSPLAFPARQSVSRVSPLKLAGPAAEAKIAEATARGHAAYSVTSKILIQVYGDTTEKGTLTNSGSVPVIRK